MWGVSLTHPVLPSVLSGKFVLNIPYWFLLFFFHRGSFSYTSHAGFVFIWEVLHTHPMLAFLFCGEFLLHIPCWLRLYLGSLSYTSWAVFLLFGDILLHIPCRFCFYVGSFSDTSRAVLIFRQGDSLLLPVLPSSAFFLLFFFLFSFFFLENFSYTCRTGSFSLSGEFLLYIPCWLYFYHGSFSYTYRTSWGVSLTHPMMTLCLCGFSYTSHAGFLLCGEFLLHIPIWLLFLSLAHTVVAFVFYVKSFFPLQSTLKTVH